MSNIYYNYSGSFIPGTLARAEAIAAEYTLVQKGFDKISIQGIDTGTANHYAFTTPGYPVAAYQDGNNVQFKALNTNTGASDVNINGIGIVPLTRFNGAALLAGDVSAGSWYTAVYQVAFGAFTIVSPAAYTTFAGTISGAVPAHKVGLTAAGGSATSAIPIDATLAIDQAITPTWTGLHTFAPSSAISAISVTSPFSGTTTGIDVGINRAGSTANTIAQGPTLQLEDTTAVTASAFQHSGGQTEFWQFNGSWIQWLKVAATRAVTINAPSSGVGLTVTGVAGASAAQFLTTGVQIGSPTGGDKGSGTLNVASGLYVNGTLVASGAIVTSIVAGTAISISGATGAVTVNNTGVTSIAGTANQIAASASTGAVTLSMPQNVIIPTPASGAPLTVNGSTGNQIIVNASAASTNAVINLNRNAVSNDTFIGVSGSVGGLISGDAAGDVGIRGQGNINLSANSGASTQLKIANAGNVTVSAPSSGAALTISGVSGTYIANLISGSGAAAAVTDFNVARAGSTINAIQQGPNIVLNDSLGGTYTTLQHSGGQTEVWQYNGSWAQRLKIDTSGNVNIANGTGSLSPVYAGIPQNSQGGSYTCVLADANKHIYSFGAGTITLPANASVAYPIGTAITIINGSGGNISVAITSDTLRLANSASTGTRTLANNAVTTAIKITATVWYISGSGIT